MVFLHMVSKGTFSGILTQQMITTIFGLLALVLGFYLSLSQGNVVIIAFMGLFSLIIALILFNQIRTSIHESRYA